MIYARWVQLLCYFDLTTAEKPSFSKFVCLAILLHGIATNNLTLGIIIAILAASFGRSVFLAFLHRSNVQATETAATARQEIIERREASLGIEPA